MKALQKISKTLLALGLLLLIGLPQTEVYGTHFAGLDYEFECLNNCTTRVHFRGYRDCGGLSTLTPAPTMIIPFDTACAAPTPVNAWSGPITVEVTPVCPGVQTNCTNSVSTITGYEEHHYWRDYDICNLGTGCGEYYVTYNTCCRPATLTSGSNSNATQIDSSGVRVNFAIGGTCNNSPDMTTTPLFYLCLGDTTVHNLNAVDADGDSLSYALTACMQSIGTPINYAVGYSPSSPLGPSWTTTIDPATGDITFTPNPGNTVSAVMCITIFEWRNGVQIGRTTRDFLITTINCPGLISNSSFVDIDNEVNGIESNWNVYALPGDTIYFDINTTSGGVPVDMYTGTLPTGAQFIDPATGLPTDTISDSDPTGRICWATPSTAGSHSFYAYLASTCGGSVVDQLINIILVDSTDLVWPGDANNDNVANMSDLLALGLAYGSTGPARATITNTWAGQVAIPFNDTIPGGIDKKYQDCNGDGTVGTLDTVALSLNFGLSHNKGIVYNKGGAADPMLWVEFMVDSAMVGDTIEAKVFLGDQANPANDVYGMSFSYMYDKTLIDSASISVTYNSSWIGTSANSLGMYKDFYSTGQLDMGFTRIDHMNSSGNGEVATIGLILTDNIDGKREIITEVLHTMLANVLIIDTDGKSLPLSQVNGDSLVVFEIDSRRPGPAPEDMIRVYPNPASGQFFVESSVSRISEIEVVNLMGQTVQNLTVDAIGKIKLDTRSYGNGLYYLKIRTGEREVVKRIVIRN